MRTLIAVLVALLVSAVPTSAQLAKYEPLIRQAARSRDVPPEIAIALVRVESSFQRSAVSPVGAIGLTQVMPRTGWLVCGLPPHRLYRPWPNLYCGMHYLRLLYERFGSWSAALAAYNVGPTRLSHTPHLGQDYASRVLLD